MQNFRNEEKFLRQLSLEREMEGAGFDKVSRSISEHKEKGSEAMSCYGRELMKKGIEPLTEAIKIFLEESRISMGRKHIAAKLIEKTENPQKVAFLSLRQVLNLITTPQTLAKAAVSVGNVLEKEARLVQFKKSLPEIYKNIDKFVKTRNEAHRYASFRAVMNKNNIPWEKWTLNERVQLGVKLINLIASSTGYIKIETVPDKSAHKVNMVAATAECVNLIEKISNSALMTPEYLPMIIPPKDWQGSFGGGYYSALTPMPLVKARFNRKEYLLDLEKNKDSMQTLYTAVNAVQRTPYKINTKVYNVLLSLWQKGGGGILPEKESRPLPECPICHKSHEDFAKDKNHSCFNLEENKEIFINWKRLSEETYSYNARLFGKQMLINKILHLANKFKDEESIYFPIQLDFRGRAYPVCSFLHPQGSDFAKGILQFAQGKPLIDFDGVKWLAVHGANLFGKDKISFEDRLIWVLENEEKIISSANEPLKELWWQQASKPFQFLAFCFEWADYVESCINEEVFVSYLPVAMDGTCNGLQIFSLLMRDEEGGKATNLVNSSAPMDIYGIVASKVTKLLEEKAFSGKERYKKDSSVILFDEKEVAKLLLDLGIDRYATKRQVMTLPYGALFSSCKEYTYKWLSDKKETKADKALFQKYQNPFIPAVFLAELIWQSINDTVFGAKTAMEYLRKTADVVTSAGLPLSWTTPVGFKVVQAYKTVSGRRIKCELGSGTVFVSVKEEAQKIDRRFQKNGISPNFIHSLDASSMMKTVEIALKQGVSAFAMVHDSYGCHAADCPILATSLRQAFADIFKDDLLERFGEETSNRLAKNVIKKMPAQPPKGNLDVKGVLKSDYFCG